ncbi:MAG: NADH-quinone oxidoreductase subunit L [Gammaproteobacteria bacterium]|nr:NADH-quinone oxidoreductase subunit L [Gammaproteobacteria bacterium]
MNLLFLSFAFPLAGFVFLAFMRGRIRETPAALVGVGSIGLSALVIAWAGYQFLTTVPAAGAYTEGLWPWIRVGNFDVPFALHLDALSLLMCGVITGVGFLIHLFASWYMRGEEGYARFFSYMNLFVASMLFLVLADNLLFLYFGWEGVGLCSYLLIGFYYKDPANGSAARKAFIVTRVGDTLMAIGLFVIFRDLGTLDIQSVLKLAPTSWGAGSATVTLVAFLLLGGAVGKSAQLPLQTWLPDAMAGPTPVSALIHAATMVTAGVYLIARTHTLFELAPEALQAVGIVGAATLLLAGFSALAQTDIKRVLAYSTMSQIGYMFLALGVGAWSGAVFHLMTHAFFKALLFLASGSVIIACHHEQDMFKMGGLRKKLPLTFWSFIIGGAALAAIPPTAGFFSKDGILRLAWASGEHGLWVCGALGAFLTSVYTFRMIFITFFGDYRGHAEVHRPRGLAHNLPLVGLIVASAIGGFWALHLMVLPPAPTGEPPAAVEFAPLLLALAGLALAWRLFLLQPQAIRRFANAGFADLLRRWWLAAFGFDWLYGRLLVRPFYWITRLNARDVIDWIVTGIPVSSLQFGNGVLARSESGRLRWYAASVALGAVAILAAVLYS